MKIKSNKINELYEEWSGEPHTNNSNKQVHDSAECTDFAEYCIKYAVSKQRERYMDLYRIIKQAYHLGRDNGSGRSEKNLNDFIEKPEIKHPKWIMDMFNVLEEIDKYLSENPKNYVGSGSILHTKIKECLSDDDASQHEP